jgi:hypothetical protein
MKASELVLKKVIDFKNDITFMKNNSHLYGVLSSNLKDLCISDNDEIQILNTIDMNEFKLRGIGEKNATKLINAFDNFRLRPNNYRILENVAKNRFSVKPFRNRNIQKELTFKRVLRKITTLQIKYNKACKASLEAESTYKKAEDVKGKIGRDIEWHLHKLNRMELGIGRF